MNWYNFVKFLHIVSVIAMVGGIFARQVIRSIAQKRDDPKEIASLTQAAHRLDRTMVIPGSNMVFLFGIVLAIMLKWPIFGFLQGAPKNWLLVSNILIIFSIVLVATVFLPYNRKVESLLQNAIAEGHVTTDLRAALDEPMNKWAHDLEMVVVLVIAALMVLKPF